ncbi:MAG TPA: YfhO family protein [Thermoanaerobaculia bacterium]|nr:YfhO family protein [Thermoanaerobaculia bacterium]
MSLALYAAVAAALIALSHCYIRPLSRWALVILFLLPFAYTGYALIAGRVYGPIDLPYETEPLKWMKSDYGIGKGHNGALSDLYCQMIPWRKAVQWSLQHGEWPIFNRFMLCGDILAAAAQPAAYSPFTLLACLLPVAHSITFSAAIAFFLAGLGAFLFARELGCREGAALIASAGFMYSTALAFFILWPLGTSWSFLPFVLLGVRRIVEAPNARSIAILTTGLTLLLLAGHPETALHVVVLGIAYGVFQLARRFRARALAAALLAGALALLLCAIYLLPIFEAVPQTMEHYVRNKVYAKAPRGVNNTTAGARIAMSFFPYLFMRHWTSPRVQEMPLDSFAVGSIVLALALYAIWRIRSPETWCFTAMIVFCIAAHSEWIPLARLLQKLPLFDISFNERFAFGAACLLAILAAMGAEQLARRNDAKWTFLAVLALITIGNLWITRSTLVTHESPDWGESRVVAEIAGLGIATLLVILRIPHATKIAALLGIIVLQRFVSEGDTYHSFPARAAYPPIPILESLKHVKEPFRITGKNLSLIPATATMYELEDVRGYEAMTNTKYALTYRIWCTYQPVWFNRNDDLTRSFLSFLNVRYAITWTDDPVPDGWREVARQRGSKLLENTRVIERASVPRFVRVGYPDELALNQMALEPDFREHAWIRAPYAQHERANGPGVVTIRNANLGYEIDATMERAGWIVISELAWNGWRAYVDDHRVEWQIANTSFVSVHVPEGKHRVRLVYRPVAFVNGRWITFATLIGIAITALTRSVRGRRASLRTAPHPHAA